MSTHAAATEWIPSTEEDRIAVWQQLDRLLSDPSFNRSKRYPSLLRFIVARSLDGDSETLKERLIGIEVFGRQPDYDSVRDPIVRVTAAEIRKRMVHYYSDPLHQDELRLLLRPGSYIPQFIPPSGRIENHATPIEHLPTKAIEASPPSEPKQFQIIEPVALIAAETPKKASIRWLIFALVAASIVLAVVVALRIGTHNAVNAFWAPAFRSSAPILICINDHPLNTSQLIDATNPVFPTHPVTQAQVMTASSVQLIADITRYFSEHGRLSKIQGQSRTTFDDIKGGPTVLFGAYNNYWTLKMTEPLRFHFANSSDMNQFWIEDRQSPERRDWSTDANVKVHKDYALLARFVPPSTGQPTFVIAGLRPLSMTEAVKLLLSPELLKKLPKEAAARPDANLEIVIETDIVDGIAGTPSVLAIHTW